MASLHAPESPSQSVGGTLSRSRSRYKGGRPITSLTSLPKMPSIASEQISHPQGETLSIHGRRTDQALSTHSEALTSSAKKGSRRRRVSRTSATHDEKHGRGGQPRDFGITEVKGDVPRSRQRESFSTRSLQRESGATKSSDPNQPDRSIPHNVKELAATRRPLALPEKSSSHRIAGQTTNYDRSKSREELKRTISAPIAIEPSESTVLPAFDAPISAVNAGERRVTIQYGQTTLSVPVTPSTTPVDIIYYVSDQISEVIDPKMTALLESFRQLGLDRPLRRYEHVRDVLNSWDNDTQHTLIIIASPIDGRHEDLELKCVPTSQPGDTSVQLYHSRKPGHWDKRWVTLRTDGQVVLAKKDDGETLNICHLSDFDIYIPTARQLAKKIKPPRKLCFAVKSQQKSSMFISTVNFVHFFSTSDKALATAWYKAVQEWRSWYLVNVMGEGTIPKNPADQTQLGPEASSNSLAQGSGSIKPNQGKCAFESRSASGNLPRTLTMRNKATSPISSSRKLTKDANTGAPTTRKLGPSMIQTPSHCEPELFATTGLLGRTYTQRQKAQRDSGRTGGTNPPPPVPVTKPLVDLTPKFQVAPQFAKRGRGVTPKNIPSGGLVAAATSPEAAISVPPTTTWQRPRTSGGGGNMAADLRRTRTLRHEASGSPAAEARQASVSPDKGGLAFTGGLLADTSRGQGGRGTGRGVMIGDRAAKAPLLDATEDSKYIPGSLLERVAKHGGVLQPVIEREKKREVNAPIGEGFKTR